jgi:hypothetical protein
MGKRSFTKFPVVANIYPGSRSVSNFVAKAIKDITAAAAVFCSYTVLCHRVQEIMM